MKKTYWKIFSLAFIAIIFFPISLLVSCSTINIEPTVNYVSTTFAFKGNVSSSDNLNNLLPSEYSTNISRNYILNFIYNNMIHGKKDSLSINNLCFISAIANDDLGTLVVKYSVRNYWKDNIQQNDAFQLEVTLEGFAKKTIPTEFKNTTLIDIANQNELSKLNINELKENKNLLQKFLFDNEIMGNKNELSSSNIVIINFFNEESDAGKVSINYEVDKYWSNKGIVLNNNKKISINLSGFVKVKLTDEQILGQINYGGTFGKLSINKFMPIVQYLNITEKTRLNSLDVDEINNQMKLDSNFKNINLEIMSANQSNKTLSFQISGSYKNIQIPLNQIISINGFYNSIDDYEEFSKFASNIYIFQIDFNLDNYFKKLQTTENIKTWSSNDWINTYLLNLTIQKFPTTSNYISFNLIDYFQNKIFENITFKNVTESIVSKSWKKLSIDVDYANYQYNLTTKSWDKINDAFNKKLNFTTDDSLKFNVPNEKDAIDWIAENATDFNNEEIGKYFASYPYSLYQKDDNESFNSWITIDDEYKTKYFNNGNLILILDSMTIDDWNGSVFISYKLDYKESQFTSKPLSMQTSGFKKLSTFINDNSLEKNNLIQVNTTLEPKSSLFNNIIRSIKKEFTTDQLKNMQVDIINNMSSMPILFKNLNLFNLFNGEKLLDDKLDEAYLKYIDVNLFNNKISRKTINIDSNLFMPNRSNESKFIINYIYVKVLQETRPILIKSNNSFIYKVPFKYIIGTESSNESSVEIDSYYFATILNSDLGF